MRGPRHNRRIDRREFLAASAAAGALATVAPFSGALARHANLGAGQVNRVAVIGAGIVGAAIAYNLSKRGCEAILIDKRGPAAQASGNSFAWLNASYFDKPTSYYNLRAHSINEYHRLARDVEIPVRWGGSLEWYNDKDREQEVAEGVRHIQSSGAATWMLDADQVADLDPNLQLNGRFRAAYSSRDGAVDPGGTTRALVKHVEEYGGTAVYPATVEAIRERANKMVVKTNVDSFEVDLVVIAAGAGANELATMIDLQTDLVKTATSGVIVTTRPMPMLLNTVAYTTATHFHQQLDGRIILGEKAGPPQSSQHSAYLTDRPNAYPTAEIAMQHARRVIETASPYLPQLVDAEIEKVGVGWRPLPLDGLPVVGRPESMPGIYLAAMHSGVTLAPVIGHLAAMEILDGVTIDLLADFRVERFLSA